MKALRTVLLDTLYGTLNQDCGRIYLLGQDPAGDEIHAKVVHVRRNEGVIDMELLISVTSEEGARDHTVHLGVKVSQTSAPAEWRTP